MTTTNPVIHKRSGGWASEFVLCGFFDPEPTWEKHIQWKFVTCQDCLRRLVPSTHPCDVCGVTNRWHYRDEQGHVFQFTMSESDREAWKRA